jgi:hypothetical protein
VGLKMVYSIVVDGVARYYGIGNDKRLKDQLRVYTPVVRMYDPEATIEGRILAIDLTEEQAIAMEKELRCPETLELLLALRLKEVNS